MNLAQLKAKIAARKREGKDEKNISRQPSGITESRATPNQAQILNEMRRNERPSFYHFIVHFEGLLNERELIRAVNKVIENQLALRTLFFKKENDWFLRIEPFSETEIKMTDLTELGEAEKDRATSRLAVELGAKTLNILNGELFRLHLIRLSETYHQLVVAISHICCDFASLGILNREVITNYFQATSNLPIGKKGASVNYFDYCKWLEESREKGKWDEKKKFWLKYLENAEPLRFDGKVDRETDKKSGKDVENIFTVIPSEIKEKLEILTAKYSFSPMVIHLAVFALTLSGIAGQKSITISTPTSGRDKSELENLIGCFANLLIFNVEIEEEIKFIEFLEKVRANILKCFEHQDTPYELIEESAPGVFGKSAVSPANTIFSYNEVKQSRFDVTGLHIRLEMLDTHQTESDLMFIIYSDSEILISAKYKNSVYSTEKIRELQEKYLDKLKHFTFDPEARIG
ncbi:MAG: condensation domain-containing protein [Pyrinomonadaceae bacterium]|nr:condensation domain-containing protein [Pyrinomonadaceae bacterium]